jgi:hypothetical protein
MLDANDDLQASMFDALHGYYRAGFSALRNALELMTIGTCGAIRNSQQYTNWRHGSVEFKFGTACDQLSNEPLLDASTHVCVPRVINPYGMRNRDRSQEDMPASCTGIYATMLILGPVLPMAIYEAAMVRFM